MLLQLLGRKVVIPLLFGIWLTGHAPGRGESPPEPGGEWLSQVLQSIATQEYQVSHLAGGIQAPNRAQGFRTYFHEAGIEMIPRVERDMTWRFRWRTARWGRVEGMMAVSPVAPDFSGAGVQYRYPGMVEWYENQRNGLEQGFTIPRPPAGGGVLRIDGEAASLYPVLRDESTVDLYDDDGTQVLQYAGLRSWDASGRELPSWMTVNEGGISLLVNDAGARYPVTIDPIISPPLWTVVEPQANSSYGDAVATAGDVNGDGYSDIIVGAHFYDTGHANAGRVYVYLGSATGPDSIPVWTTAGDTAAAGLGFAVAPAGDVNGDGYDDVIVGAQSYTDEESLEGRAFVYLGSASGPEASPVWMGEGNAVFARFGYSVDTAGDVNGDGYADIIVGAPQHSDEESEEGRAYIYLGSPSGPSPTADWMVEGNQSVAWLGISVGTAGDVNGDGYADVIVGAERYDSGQLDEGVAFVYHGSPTVPDTLAAWIGQGDQSSAAYGHSVAGAGDINGDGYADIVVGARDYDLGQADEGRIFVYLGGASGVAASPTFTAESNQASARLGSSVGTAGDVNGDGYADVIAGAPNFDVLQSDDGIAYVYMGQAGGGMLQIWSGFSNELGARFGASVGTAGDVNGDGRSDILVGAPGARRASVYTGYSRALGALSATMDGNKNDADLGFSVGTAGDVNGDGYDDVVIGAPAYDVGLVEQGRVYVFPGSATGVVTTVAWGWDGSQDGANFGSAVGTAGDVNGDGYSDVIVGAKYADGDATDSGMAFVYHGGPAGLSAFPAWSVSGTVQYAQLGESVGTAGDVNGDGYSDVIVGAPNHAGSFSSEGAAYMYHGSSSGLSAAAAWQGEGGQTQGFYGTSVGCAGDVNRDGYSDIVIGAPRLGVAGGGAVYVHYGSPSGVSSTPDWTGESTQSNSLYGHSVGTAGDVNGDGYSDVVIGAPRFDQGQDNEGKVFVHHGSVAGLEATAAWENDGDQIGAQFGYSVGTAGDADGDGYSEVVVGAVFYTNGQANEGRATLYLGSSTGLPSFHDVASRMEGDQANAAFGASVGTAGDVNGDGFSDVVVGAWRYDSGQTDEGRAFVYLGGRGGGTPLLIGQREPGGGPPIASLGITSGVFEIHGVGRCPAGTARARLQVEIKPLGTQFDGTDLRTGPEENTGTGGVALSQLVSGLLPGTPYHWRARFLSDNPRFPATRWLWMADNGVLETDIRTRSFTTSAGNRFGPGQGIRLRAAPNPFRSEIRVGFTLSEPGNVRLSVFDVSGRMVSTLVDGELPTGPQSIRWDGRDANGVRVAGGVYYLQLAQGGESATQRVTLIR